MICGHQLGWAECGRARVLSPNLIYRRKCTIFAVHPVPTLYSIAALNVELLARGKVAMFEVEGESRRPPAELRNGKKYKLNRTSKDIAFDPRSQRLPSSQSSPTSTLVQDVICNTLQNCQSPECEPAFGRTPSKTAVCAPSRDRCALASTTARVFGVCYSRCTLCPALALQPLMRRAHALLFFLPLRNACFFPRGHNGYSSNASPHSSPDALNKFPRFRAR